MSAPPAIVPIDSLYPNAEALHASPITPSLLDQYAEITKTPAPHLLRRGIFGAQIDFADALDRVANQKPLYIFLSITPSNRLFHLRHIAAFSLAKQLQAAFNCFVVVHILDTKACLIDQKVSWKEVSAATEETVKDILAFGFNPTKTILLPNSQALSLDYIYLCDLQRHIPYGPFFENFFKDDQVSTALLDVVFQNVCFTLPKYLAKIFPNYADFRALVILRPSQQRFYQMACQLAGDGPKPIAIYGGFIPALQSGQKMPRLAAMAAVDTAGKGKKDNPVLREYMSIYLKNPVAEIAKKINKSALSGGRDSTAEQKELGANLAVDVPFYLLTVFEEDDALVEQIRTEYGPGELPGGNDKRLLTGGVKKTVAASLGNVVTRLQQARAEVAPAIVAQVTALRPLQ
jgi:tryptophanyl-tRNA synthetase